MLTAVAIIPSAPVLIPELAGAAANEIADLRDAVFAAAATLPDRWLAIGVGAADAVVAPGAAGTFAGYGVDVRVQLSPTAAGVRRLPLCALITGWVRGRVRPHASAQVQVFAHDHDPATAAARGQKLRATLDEAAEPIGVLVVADGAHTLTPAAPGGHDPGSVAVQGALDDALAAGHAAALAGLPGSITGRVAWQVLAGMTQPAPRCAKELYRGAPYGVGYFAGVWQP
ncbi:MAG: hypothetical protein JO044_01695 [Mycobacteriaceae bacterium]|nr:hypothetical protein [Mycobacteriaceae bacterium]MBV9640731.1 hypothetical protein [Mycobacteriaceae bacterium]